MTGAAEFALRQGRGIAFLAVAAAVAGGLVSQTLPKAVYPEVVFLREQVVATAPGASGVVVMAGVTRPLEEAMSSVPGVERIRSRTIRGGAELSLFFAPGTDMVQAHSVVLSRLGESSHLLRVGAEVTASRVLPSGFPILSMNIRGPFPAGKLYELAQYTLRPALSSLPGVGLVSVQSSDIPEVEVLLKPAALEAAHLTVSQVADRLRQMNIVQTVARLTDAHQLSLGIVTGELITLTDIESAVVGGTDQAPVRVRDLGRVVEGVAPRTTLIRVDGQPGVILNVARRLGGDILALNTAVAERLAELKPSLPTGLVIEPVYEQAAFVRDAVLSVRDAILFGALFTVLVLAFFLRDWRATLVAALSLPLTLGASLLVLWAMGQTLNLMTLGGLAVSVGLVIDDAVVVVEAVHKYLEEGLSPAEAARRGTAELFWPVVGTTATTVVVFLPLGLLNGVSGQFFIALSLSLAAAVVISLPVALAVLPVIASRLLKPVKRKSAGDRLGQLYVRALTIALRHRLWVVLAGLAVVGLGTLCGRSVATDFLPESDEGAYVIDYFAPVGASMDSADTFARQIEEIVRSTPEVSSFSRRLGAELGPPAATISSRGDVAVRLKSDRSRGVNEIMDEQRARIAAVAPGLRVEFVQVLADMLGDLEGSAEPVEVKVFGPDVKRLNVLMVEINRRLEKVPGLTDIFNGNEGCSPERDLTLDPVQAGRQNLSAGSVGLQLASAYLGEVSTQLRRPDHLENIRVRQDSPEIMTPGDLSSARVMTSGGTTLPVSAISTPTSVCPPASSLRENQRNYLHFTARLSNVSLGEATSSIRANLAGWVLPTGYSWELAGLFKQQQSSFHSLWVALAIAMLAVTGILLFQLKSYRRTAAVLAATPVALAGAVVTLVVLQVSLNVSSMMGAILLIGLVVKNGILLIDYALVAEGEGLSSHDAIISAARARLRPILMTTLATLVALIPLALGIGAGAALHRPLAITVLGGLLFSTAATLFMVPALSLSPWRCARCIRHFQLRAR